MKSIAELREEYMNIPYYEGRMGASAREMKSILYSAVENHEFACLSPLSVLREMEEFVKRLSEYEFLKQDVKDGFHDAPEFINSVRNEYLTIIDREVRDSTHHYMRQFENGVLHGVVSIGDVVKNRIDELETERSSLTGYITGERA